MNIRGGKASPPERPTIVVEVEEDGKEHGEGQRREDIADADLPEVDEPAPIGRRKECRTGREPLQLDLLHPPHVYETGKEDDRQGSPVVLEKHSNSMIEQGATT